MNILMILSNAFTHDPRVQNEAKSLIKAGYNVTVLAWDKKKENPPRETKDGIHIVRFYNTKFMDQLRYDTFKLRFWWKNGYKKAIELNKENHFDIIHCHDLDTLPIGVKIKKKLGLPLIYDAHEIYGYMVARFLPKWWANYFLWKEKRIIKHVNRIITVNQPLNEYFTTITKKPVTIVMNCKHLQGTTYEPPKNNIFTLLYIGGFYKSRFLLELVDLVKELTDVHCIIGGMGASGYVKALKEKCSKIHNIDFIGRVPMDEVIPKTKSADLIVCMINPADPNNSIALGNKHFEALVCGRPIIRSKGTYAGEMIEKLQCGLTVDFTKESVKEAIIKLKDNPKICEKLGRNAFKAAKEQYNWPLESKKLLKVYRELEIKD